MRVAIVGCGQIARVHLLALAGVPDVKVVGVCDRDRWRAEEFAGSIEGANAYTDWQTLLQTEHPEVVHILTPPHTHTALALQAIEAGCHTLVEKPVALCESDANRLIEAARAHNVKLCVNHNLLFKPAMLKARALVESGAIGQVVYIDGFYGMADEGSVAAVASGRSHWAAAMPGGLFSNFLPHPLSVVLHFLAQDASVTAVALDEGQEMAGTAPTMSVLLASTGATGVITLSLRARPYVRFVDLYGTRGILHVDLVREICTVHRAANVPRMIAKATFTLQDSLQLGWGTVTSTVGVLAGKIKPYECLHTLVHRFYESIREDKQPPVSGADGARVVRFMENIWSKMPSTAAPVPVAPTPVAKPTAPQSPAEEAVAASGLPGKVLVTGGTGFLGRRLIAALSRCGAEIVTLVRDRDTMTPEMRELVSVVPGDLRDPAALATAMRDVAIVLHCAAVTTNSAPWAQHQAVNIDATAAVYEAARQAGVQRLVYVSSVVAYGLERRRGQALVDESAPYGHGDHWAYYLRSKQGGDAKMLQLAQEGALPSVIVRLGLLYGPGGRMIGGGLPQIGKVQLLMGAGRNHLPYTYVDNAVDALLLAAIAPDAAGQAINIVDDPQVTVREALRTKMAATGQKVTLIPVPAALLMGGARLFEWRAARRKAALPPKLTRYVVRSACRDLRYDTTRARALLGWQPATGLAEGLRKTWEHQEALR